ncbi:MAG: DUF3857 domain-containing protein [Acidipila sp.]|nr:DUF3857 domain-containing protein [Acidipila sp.]
MFVRRLFPLALVLLLCAAASRVRPVSASDEGFRPISPEELKMTSEPQAPGAPAIILLHQVDRDDNGNNEYKYLRIKILTEEGRKYADIEIPFVKGIDSIHNIKARTIRPDGAISLFDGKIYEKTVVKARGWKYLAKTFTLPDVQVGSVIEYYYADQWDAYLLYDSAWILSDELFTKQAKFSLQPYSQRAVRWSWQGLPSGAQIPKEAQDHHIRLDASNIPAFLAEDFMPPADQLKARVDFVYSEDTPELDPVKFWKREGKKFYERVENFVGKRKAMEQAVAQIVSPGDAPDTKLQKIYARVQQLRNTSFEVQKTEQEAKRAKEKEINNVEDLWKHGMGSGGQITWLYLALVRAAGFEAYPVLVSSRNKYFFKPNLLNPSQLNSNVMVIKLNGKDIFCDPGTSFVPYGLLPWAEAGVAGLQLDKDGGSWVTTTFPPSAASRIERKANFKLTEVGDLEGALTVTFTGLEALGRRIEERNQDETTRKTFLEDLVKESIPAGINVELINKPDWGSSAAPLIAEFNLKIPGWASGAGRRALLPVGFFSSTEKHLFEHASRVYPVYFEFPFQKLDEVTIQPPLGWRVANLPPVLDVNARVVTYKLKVENKEGNLHVERALSIDFLQLDVKAYPALRDFFQGVKTGDDQQIILQPDGAASKN